MKKLTFLLVCFVLVLSIGSVSYGQTSQGSVAWNVPTTGGAPTGYRLYAKNQSETFSFGPSSPFLLTTVTVPGTDASPVVLTFGADGSVKNLVVTAFNTYGEGPASNQIDITLPDKRPPGAPGQFRVIVQFAYNADGSVTMILSQVERIE